MSSDSENQQGKAPSFSIVERAADGKFFLHILCFALYLDIAIQTVLGKSLPNVTWSDFLQLPPGTYFMVLLVYSSLMGLGFRIAYALLTYSLGWFNRMYLTRGRDTWRNDSSYVSREKIRWYTFTTKDTEPMKQLQAQQETSRTHRKTMSEFGYLMFAALAFLTIGYLMDSYVHHDLLPWVESSRLYAPVYGLVLLGFAFMIWFDATAEVWQDDYLYHPELAEYLKNLKA